MHPPFLPHPPAIPGHCIYCSGGWNVLPPNPLCCHFLGQAVSPSQRFPGIRSNFCYLVPACLHCGTVNYVGTGLCLGFPLTVKTNIQGKGPTFPESWPSNGQTSKTRPEPLPRRYWAWGLPRMHLCFLMLATEVCDQQ